MPTYLGVALLRKCSRSLWNSSRSCIVCFWTSNNVLFKRKICLLVSKDQLSGKLFPFCVPEWLKHNVHINFMIFINTYVKSNVCEKHVKSLWKAYTSTLVLLLIYLASYVMIIILVWSQEPTSISIPHIEYSSTFQAFCRTLNFDNFWNKYFENERTFINLFHVVQG